MCYRYRIKKPRSHEAMSLSTIFTDVLSEGIQLASDWMLKSFLFAAPFGGFQKWGYPKWMVYNGQSIYKWMIWG